MEKIKILIDASGSANFKEIENQLLKIKNDNAEKAEIDVSFLSFERNLKSNLDLLQFPLPDKCKIMGGSTDFSEEIKNVKDSYSKVIFIGDFMDLEIKKDSLNDGIKYLFICTEEDINANRYFLSKIIENSNVRGINVVNYTSLENEFNKVGIKPMFIVGDVHGNFAPEIMETVEKLRNSGIKKIQLK